MGRGEGGSPPPPPTSSDSLPRGDRPRGRGVARPPHTIPHPTPHPPPHPTPCHRFIHLGIIGRGPRNSFPFNNCNARTQKLKGVSDRRKNVSLASHSAAGTQHSAAVNQQGLAHHQRQSGWILRGPGGGGLINWKNLIDRKTNRHTHNREQQKNCKLRHSTVCSLTAVAGLPQQACEAKARGTYSRLMISLSKDSFQ